MLFQSLLFSVCFLSVAMAQDPAAFQAADLDTALSPAKLAAQLANKRVVFVGETHDRYDHHLNQLEIIKGLHQLDPNISIGVEYLEQRFQPKVDDYIAGKINEQEFLRATEYYEDWRYDYRLYAPIFRYAREQHIPVRALNVPPSLAFAAGKTGIAGLSKDQRAALPPDITPADPDYRRRLRAVFEEHGAAKPDAFDHFVDGQLVWDESMAAGAASYLSANPDRRMVILAGSGHIAFGSGIPQRLERRTHATYSIVLNGGDDEDVAPHMADYLLLSAKQELPPAGILGANLEDKDAECRIRTLLPGGAAEKAGMKPKDVLISIDGQPIKRVSDVKLALWDKKPGDRVQVVFRQKKERTVGVELQAAGQSQK